MPDDSGAVRTWRHNAPAWRHTARTALGTVPVSGPPIEVARTLDAAGAKLVEIDEVIAADAVSGGAHHLWLLSVVRELTARAIDVSWVLGADVLTEAGWRAFSHLVPPREILGADPLVLASWRQRHYIGRCMYRKGPGFLQIRDRRWDELRSLVLDEPAYLAAVAGLADLGGDQAVPRRVRDAFIEERLLVPVGERYWWAPYRLRRWPLPCSEV
jgi:hypothetical protein